MPAPAIPSSLRPWTAWNSLTCAASAASKLSPAASPSRVRSSATRSPVDPGLRVGPAGSRSAANRPTAAIFDQPAAKVGVDRVDRGEEVDRSAGPGGEAHVAHRSVVVHGAGNQFLVDVDHVDALLDRRRQIDRLQRGRLVRSATGDCHGCPRPAAAAPSTARRPRARRWRRGGGAARTPDQASAIIARSGRRQRQRAEREQGKANGHAP